MGQLGVGSLLETQTTQQPCSHLPVQQFSLPPCSPAQQLCSPTAVQQPCYHPTHPTTLLQYPHSITLLPLSPLLNNSALTSPTSSAPPHNSPQHKSSLSSPPLNKNSPPPLNFYPKAPGIVSLPLPIICNKKNI